MQKKFEAFIHCLLYPSLIMKLSLLLALTLFEVLCWNTVYQTGGTKQSYIHLFYIPIILGGTFFRIPGGVLFATIAGILTYPRFLLADVENNILQTNQVWLFRSVFFMLMGILSGLSSSVFRQFLKIQEQRFLTDPVTGLPNFVGLSKFFDLQKANTESYRPSLIVLTLKRLSEIDRAVGAEITEKLLKQVGQDLKRSLQGIAYVGYRGSGTFVLIIKNQKETEQAFEMCKTQLGPVYTIADIPLFLQIHYGVAYGSEVDKDLMALLRKAQIAVENSIRNDLIKTDFKQEDDDRAKKNVELLHDLANAIKESQLILHYQPKISFKTNQVIGVEALVRWPHPKYGLVSPAQFIPLTESTVLINPFTHWLIRQSLKQLSEWQKNNFPISLAINVSMKNFQDPLVIEELYNLLEEYHIAPSTLEIEVTESSVAKDIKSVADILFSLQEHGMKIAVDDFGTGHSALSYLFELPIDVLKIDQAFIRAMSTNSAAEAIVRSAVLLGHELNLEVVAEGIETQEEYDRLKSIGCDVGQGFLSRPMPPELCTAWLKKEFKKKA